MLADWVYPKGGWGRAISYVLHRLRRLPDPPHRIARGVAAGVFVCYTPFFGLHFFLAAFLAFLMQGNIVAALLATFFGNPVTFPLIAAACLELGNWMLGTDYGLPLPMVFDAFTQATSQLWENFLAIFSMKNFMPLVDLLFGDVQVGVNKAMLVSFCKNPVEKKLLRASQASFNLAQS